jgi:hypothetical protein
MSSTDERRIVQEKNVTAIVREHDPDMVRRWDADLDRNKTWDKSQVRATALNLAVSIFNAEPKGYARVVRALGVGEEETIVDFFGEEIRPLANRIHSYLMQDQEE